jgi:hypothetical protein
MGGVVRRIGWLYGLIAYTKQFSVADTSRSRMSIRPKLRPVRWVTLGLNWCFSGLAGCCSGYFKVSGIGTPRSSKASRWALVGSVSIGTVAGAPANRTWLRVKVARWSSSPRKLR